MSPAATVVINAAGLGTRLGLNIPKVLVEVGGKSMLQHHLEMLDDWEEVVVVAGYRAREVTDVTRDLRPDVTIALNHEFSSTGTAASLVKGARISGDYVVSLDGDLLVDREDFYRLASCPGACLGLIETTSSEPVCARLSDDGRRVIAMSQDWRSEWEWSGLLKASRAQALNFGRGHVFQGVVASLPIEFVTVDCVEIDHPADIVTAEAWLASRAEASGG